MRRLVCATVSTLLLLGLLAGPRVVAAPSAPASELWADAALAEGLAEHFSTSAHDLQALRKAEDLTLSDVAIVYSLATSAGFSPPDSLEEGVKGFLRLRRAELDLYQDFGIKPPPDLWSRITPRRLRLDFADVGQRVADALQAAASFAYRRAADYPDLPARRQAIDQALRKTIDAALAALPEAAHPPLARLREALAPSGTAAP